MVLVHELRILHPYTVEEFERGQMYGNLKAAEQLEQGGQGSLMVSSDKYYDEVYGEGAFNRSVTSLGEGRLPAWAVKMFPAGALNLDEKCWTIYPYCKTSVTVPALSYLKCDVLSLQLQDSGTSDNALRLPKELLDRRTVEYIDLGAAQVDPKDYREDRDPALVASKVTGKGPLTPGWQQRETPIMCAYKVIVAEFRYTGLQGTVERFLVGMMKNLFTLTHKICFCTLDEWHPLRTEEVMDMLDRRRAASGCKVVEQRRSSVAPSCLLVEAAAAAESQAAAAGAEGEAGPVEAESSGLEGAGSEGLSDVGGSSDATDDEDEGLEFLDAEMDWGMGDSLGTEFADTRLLGPTPAACPGCTHLKRNPPQPPAYLCTACQEFLCAACFDQIHITPKLLQHRKDPLPPPLAAALSLRCASISIAGPVVHQRFARSGGYRRSASTAPASGRAGAAGAPGGSLLQGSAAAGAAGVAGAAQVGESSAQEGQSEPAGLAAVAEQGLEALALGEAEREAETEGELLSWDKVKDPPLNVFAGRPRSSPEAGTGPATGTATGTAAGDREGEGEGEGEGGSERGDVEWVRILDGDAEEGEEGLVEVPSALRKDPTELAAAMVALMAGLYRSTSGATPVPPSPSPAPFPLAPFLPDWHRWARLFPAFCDPSNEDPATPPVTVSSAPSPGVTVSSGPLPPSGAGGGTPAGTPVVVRTPPGPTSDRALEQQRLEVARIYRSLAEELVEVDPLQLRDSPAFWVNAHNALLMHAYIVFGVPRTPQELSVLLRKASYLVGGVRFSAAAIDQSVLAPPDAPSFGRIVAGLPRVGNLRAAARLVASYAVTTYDPRTPFLLSLGIASSPPVRVMHHGTLGAQLEAAASAHLGTTVTAQGGKVQVPLVFHSHRRDFGTPAEQLEFLKRALPPTLAAAVDDCAARKVLGRRIWDVLPEDYRFSYSFC